MGSQFVRPGVIEGFSGPMASGKSDALLKRVDPLRWIHGVSYIGFKPKIDVREKGSRYGEDFIDWIYVSEENPWEILDYVGVCHDMVVIDEVQFFGKEIVGVILELQRRMKNVIFAGLDGDFRAQPFGFMRDLMFAANELTKLYSICTVCGDKAYYTQRLIGGEPARYDSPVVSIEGKNVEEKYEPRCFRHHEVPGKK
ncbi:MAG: thymidine kinase [archaeon]